MQSQCSQPSQTDIRRLEDDDPRVIVARSAAILLPPELRGHLVALADWATGKQTTH